MYQFGPFVRQALAQVAKPMAKSSAQTALDLLLLTVLKRRGPSHGYALATAIEELSQHALRLEEGSLYPALHRMEESGWIRAEWKTTENNRRARVYKLTAEGAKQLEAETKRWEDLTSAVSRVLRYA